MYDYSAIPVKPQGDIDIHPTVARWRDLWNTDPMAMVEECYAEDTVTGAPGKIIFRGRSQLRVIEQIFVEAAPKKHMTVIRTIAEGNIIVAECIITDADRPQWSEPFCAILTLDSDGLIINDTSYADFSSWPSTKDGHERILAAGAQILGS